MSRIKNIIGDVEVNRDLLLLLAVGGLYSLSIALSNTFVNVYLWKQSGQFVDLAIYNLSIVVMQPIIFMFAGRLAKKIDRVFILRFGVSFLAVFYLTVLLAGRMRDHGLCCSAVCSELATDFIGLRLMS